jgi:hypothetical protein
MLANKHPEMVNRNLRRYVNNIFDQAILLHSEKQSTEVEKYQKSEFIPVYYWSHALISLDWFRYAQHEHQIKNIKKTFLIYNRAWSGTREYRLKFIDLLIDNKLIDQCHTFCNPIEPELQIHYSQHEYINSQWRPNNQLENYANSTTAGSCSSADFDITDYNSTEFEIVLETLFDYPRIQLTEKSLRPIACGQPFLLVSSAGSLQYLQSYGFKTFDSVIDESYDKITNSSERLQAVVKVMKTITNWSATEKLINMKKIKDIVDYNRQHFFGSEFFNLVVNELHTNLTHAMTELENQNTSNKFLKLRKILAMYDQTGDFVTADNHIRSRQDVVHVMQTAKRYQNRHQ